VKSAGWVSLKIARDDGCYEARRDDGCYEAWILTRIRIRRHM